MSPYNKKRLRIALGLIGFLFVFLIARGMYTSIARLGKVGVDIQTVPSDAQVSIDGKLSSSRPYLKPGTYTFTAAKDGFEKKSTEVTISKSQHAVSLILSPVSTEAKEWAKNNQSEYEKLGSLAVKERIVTVNEKNPLIAKLPYYDITGPFSIGYAFSTEESVDAYIIIKNSTPDGRIKALRWIHDQGIDPADLTIQFKDFVNPTREEGI